jgi:zinc transport system substrate-binding protein
MLACGCLQGPASPERNISVAVGIPPLAEFVEAVGGEEVQVQVLLPPGADPHTYEPTPAELAQLSRVDLIIAVGSHLPFEDRLLQRFNGTRTGPVVVNASEGIELRDQDPHDWLSLSNARRMVNNTASALCAQDPPHCEGFQLNRDAYLERIDQADTEIRAILATARITTFLVVHPAWGYFAEEYGLTQLAIEEEGKEPSAAELAALVETVQEKGIRVVFVEPQFSTREAEILAAQINGRVEKLDPLARNFLENMVTVAHTLQEA